MSKSRQARLPGTIPTLRNRAPQNHLRRSRDELNDGSRRVAYRVRRRAHKAIVEVLRRALECSLALAEAETSQKQRRNELGVKQSG